MNNVIGVVHGGLGVERDKSLSYGKHVTKILKELGMDVLEMHLHPNGSWTVNGKVEDIESSIKKSEKVWNCLVGSDGESGIAENLCQKCKVKVLGHTPLHSHLAGDKKNMHYALSQHKIKVPYGKVISMKDYSGEKLKEVFTSVGVPAVVKPLSGSGAWGVMLVQNFSELVAAVQSLMERNIDVLVEKAINGIPVSCFVFEHNNLLSTHIKAHDNESEISREEFMNIRNESLYIHSCLAFPHHVEYDFILTRKNGKSILYFLEANTHPSLTHGYIKKVFDKGVVSLKDYIHSRVV